MQNQWSQNQKRTVEVRNKFIVGEWFDEQGKPPRTPLQTKSNKYVNIKYYVLQLAICEPLLFLLTLRVSFWMYSLKFTDPPINYCKPSVYT